MRRIRVIKAYLAKKADEEHLLSPEEQRKEHQKLVLQQEKQLSELEKRVAPMRVRRQLDKAQAEGQITNLEKLIATKPNDFLPFLNQFVEQTGNPELAKDVALRYVEKHILNLDPHNLDFLIQLGVVGPVDLKPYAIKMIQGDLSKAAELYQYRVVSFEDALPFFKQYLEQHFDLLRVYERQFGQEFPESFVAEVRKNYVSKLKADLLSGSGDRRLFNGIKRDTLSPKEAKSLATLYFSKSKNLFEDVDSWKWFITKNILTKEEIQKLVAPRVQWLKDPAKDPDALRKELMASIRIAEQEGYIEAGTLDAHRGKKITFPEAIDLWGRDAMTPEEFWGHLEERLRTQPKARFADLKWAMMRQPSRWTEFKQILLKGLKPFYAEDPQLKKDMKKDSFFKTFLLRQ